MAFGAEAPLGVAAGLTVSQTSQTSEVNDAVNRWYLETGARHCAQR
jgi:hypothetical protein